MTLDGAETPCAARIAGISGLEVIMLDQPLDKPLQELRSLHPGVIIFDMGAVQPDFVLAMLQEPGLLLIGIGPETHQALVWSGEQVAAAGAADLIRMIQKGRHGE